MSEKLSLTNICIECFIVWKYRDRATFSEHPVDINIYLAWLNCYTQLQIYFIFIFENFQAFSNPTDYFVSSSIVLSGLPEIEIPSLWVVGVYSWSKALVPTPSSPAWRGRIGATSSLFFVCCNMCSNTIRNCNLTDRTTDTQGHRVPIIQVS